QAEDGIRAKLVTGVQTCALPILNVWLVSQVRPSVPNVEVVPSSQATVQVWVSLLPGSVNLVTSGTCWPTRNSCHGAGVTCVGAKIGRASCRERGGVVVGVVSLQT